MSIIVSDLEGTLTGGESWRGVARFLRERGETWPYRKFLIAHVPEILLGRSGLLDLERAQERWMAGIARMLKGFDEDQLVLLAQWVVETELWPKRYGWLVDKLTQVGDDSYRVIIASAAYEPIIKCFAARLGAEASGTRLEMINGLATGKTAPRNAGQRKANAVRALIGTDTLDVAYGDTISDLALLEMSERPVAVSPDKRLRAVGVERGWQIVSKSGQ